MTCTLCRKPTDVPTYITMESASDKYLNRKMAVCEKCAYAILQKMLELDPLNRKCNTEA